MGVLLVPGYLLSGPVLEWLREFSCPVGMQLVYLQPLELFMTRMKLGFVLSLLLGSPYLSWQVWGFVSPAFLEVERRLVWRHAMASAGLFVFGSELALFYVYPALMSFSAGMGTDEIRPMISVSSFVGLATALMLGFGLMFQVPVVLHALMRIGLLSPETVAKSRPVAVLGIFVLAAVLTPGPDVISQLALAVPSVFLFEGALFLARVSRRVKSGGLDG